MTRAAASATLTLFVDEDSSLCAHLQTLQPRGGRSSRPIPRGGKRPLAEGVITPATSRVPPPNFVLLPPRDRFSVRETHATPPASDFLPPPPREAQREGEVPAAPSPSADVTTERGDYCLSGRAQRQRSAETLGGNARREGRGEKAGPNAKQGDLPKEIALFELRSTERGSRGAWT